MLIRNIKVHTCNQDVGELDPEKGYLVKKCTCRKYVTLAKAAQLIEDGYAQYVVTSFKIVQAKVKCPICGGIEQYVKSCNLCGKTGEISVDKAVFEYSQDIFMRPFLRTPRTATIEEEHIQYAFVKGDRDALKRIELYNELNQLTLGKLGAEVTNSKTKKVIFEGRPEPEDDPKKGQGRKYDYGRPI